MARKRYVSTNISTDEKVLELEERAGPYAVILYTWMIPHAADDGTITGRPRELKMLVVPGFDMTTADVAAAVEAMVDLGLVERWGDVGLRFPTRTFHAYQAYVKPDRRGVESPSTPPEPPESTREVPPIQEIPRSSEKSLASSSFSPSSSSSPSLSSSAPPEHPPPDAAAPDIEQPAVEREVFDYFRAKIAPRARQFPRKRIAARLKKFTADELRQGIDHFAADPWWMEHNSSRGADWFFESDARAEQFLLLTPRPKVVHLNGKTAAQPDVDPAFYKFTG